MATRPRSSAPLPVTFTVGTLLVAVFLAASGVDQVQAKKVLLMEGFDPEKVQGQWFVVRRNTELFDSVKCIKYNLKHDPAVEDLYEMTTYWINSAGAYEQTHFNIVDDRKLKARYFFESKRDKVAMNVLGTDYNSWLVGYGVNGDRETYYVSMRTKTFTKEIADAVNVVLKKNEVDRDWADVEQMDCPAEH